MSKSVRPSFHSARPGRTSGRISAILVSLFTAGLTPFFLALVSAGSSPGAPPRIFFSDLESGPSSGGENNQGAFVTLYGRRFGATRGACTVSVGGGAVENYPIWSDEKITLQLGPKARTGQIVVHCPQGSSNGLPFTVRPGNIYFVSLRGSDGNSGSFASPWQSLVRAKNSMAPGDITYALEGVSQTGMDNYGASLNIEVGGAPDKPLAIVAYPGATVTVGTVSGPAPMGIRVPNTGRAQMAKNWVIAGLRIRGQLSALNLGGGLNPSAENWRIIGNDITCPNGNGAAACAGTSRASNIKFLGNAVHDAGSEKSSKLYHGVYFGTDSNNIEVGWNHIYNIRGCRGIQFHSSPLTRDGTSGLNQHNLIVHDNLIHDVRCDAINFATVDPSRGPVQAYNNVIYHVGTGPHPLDGPADYACFYTPGATNSGRAASGQILIANNTCYDAGGVGIGYGAAGMISGPLPGFDLTVNYQNNIFYASHDESYVSLVTMGSGGSLRILGSNNLWFGNGSGPGLTTHLTGNVNGDPSFVNAPAFDFHLRPNSPAIRAGANSGFPADHDGLPRPAGKPGDIGAFQFPADSPAPNDHRSHR